MILFQFVRHFYEIHRICAPKPTESISFNGQNGLYLVTMCAVFASSAAHFLYRAESVIDYVVTFNASFLLLICITHFVTNLYEMPNAMEFIDVTEELFNQRLRENADLTAKYIELNEFIEFISKIYDIAILELTPIGLALPSVAITVANYFVYDLGEASYFLPIPLMLPFDWRNPAAYFAALCLELSALYFAISSVVSVVCLGIGFYLWAHLLIDEIQINVNVLDELNCRPKTAKRMELTKRFIVIVQDFGDLKRMIRKLIDVIEFNVTINFVWTLGAITSLIFGLLVETLNGVELIQLTIGLFWAFGTIFIICELGQRFSNRCESIDDAFYHWQWYLFPVEIQKLLTIALANSHETLYIIGYGNIPCARYTFKSTVKSCHSYFMVLRRFDA